MALGWLLCATDAGAVEPPDKAPPASDATTVLVRGDDLPAAVERAGGQLGARVAGTAFRRVRVPPGSRRAVVRRLERVADVEPNRLRRAAAEPNDPWLTKTGRQDQLRALRLPLAWDRSTGAAGVRIAVVDSGVDLDMPDLAPRVLQGLDLVDGDARPDDFNGHGTMMAGVAAAATNNGEGIAGAAWNASIIPVRVLDEDGAGFDDDIAAGIAWAADQDADVILLALGGPGDSAVLREAVAHATSRGALVVAAAGNHASERPEFPAAIPEVVAVSATDTSGVFAWLSGRGDWVDVAAPGLDVMATDRSEGPVGTYTAGDGTSFSAALVAGIAALVRAQQPGWTPARVAERLRETAQDRGPPGPDPFYGAGGVDAAAALGAPALPPSLVEADGNDTLESAIPIAFSSSRIERFDVEGDVDWFRFDLPAAGWISVGGNQVTAFRGDRAEEMDLAVELYDASGRLVDQADERGLGDDVEEIMFHGPAGRYYVRAWNFVGSRGDYDIGFGGTTPNVTDTQFSTGQGYPIGSSPQAVRIADVTGDRRNDLIAATESFSDDPMNYHLHVFEQDEDGWLRPPVRIPTRRVSTGEGSLWSLAPADLDGDGDTDIAAAVGTGIELHLQAGGGLSDTRYVSLHGAVHVDAHDLDGDGTAELVAVLAGYGVAVLSRDGDAWSRRRAVLREYSEIEIGDVTGDERPDLVGIGPGGVQVIAQRADGGFADPQQYAVPDEQWLDGVEVADVTGDGRADAIAVDTVTDKLHVLAQTADGTLAAPRTTIVTGDTVEAADMNGDGRNDVVTVAGGNGQLLVSYQRADGTLAPPSSYRYPYSPASTAADGLALGDLTGDGRADAAAADFNHGAVVHRRLGGTWPRNPLWVAGGSPVQGADGVAATTAPSVRFGRPIAAASGTVRLVRGPLRTPVAGAATYAGDRVTFTPAAALSAGAYVLEIDGVQDSQGRRMRDPYRLHFEVGTTADTTPPDTRISGGPEGHYPGTYGLVRMWATEPTSRFECRLDGATWEPCGPPAARFDTSIDAYGPHVFAVRAIDAVGRVDPTPAERRITTDDGYPWPVNDAAVRAITITGETGSVVGTNDNGSRDADFEPEHGGNAGGASVWWTWRAPRRGRVTFETTLSDIDTLLGVYTGSLEETNRLVRVAGNDDAAPDRTSAVTFTAREGQTYQIAIDGFNDGYDLDTGEVWLSWNMAGAPADVTPPETTIVDGPPAAWTVARARLRFTSSEPASTFECRLEAGPWHTCWPGIEYVPVLGPLTFEVRATDDAGNTDPTPARHDWLVDDEAPETNLTRGPDPVTTEAAPAFEFSSWDPTASFECSVDGGPWTACTSPHRVAPLADGLHDVRIRAVDALGNEDTSPERRTFSVEGGIAPPDTPITEPSASGPGAGPQPTQPEATAPEPDRLAPALAQPRLKLRRTRIVLRLQRLRAGAARAPARAPRRRPLPRPPPVRGRARRRCQHDPPGRHAAAGALPAARHRDRRGRQPAPVRAARFPRAPPLKGRRGENSRWARPAVAPSVGIMRNYETIIVGGGQAGLSVGYQLARRGRPFVILDAGERIGDTWRRRWDSLRLFTPARYDALAGMPFPAPAHSYPTKDEMADYLEAYAARFELPVLNGVRVDRVSRNGSGYVVTAGERRFAAANVVVAMSSWQRPRMPGLAAGLDPDIRQLHSSEYRNPDQLRPGDLLLVGAGNSGAEIALDAGAGRRVLLSGRDVGHVPIRIESYAARFVLPLILRGLFHRVLTTRTPMGRRKRSEVLVHGLPLVRTKPEDLAAAGVERVARVTGIRDGRPELEDGRVLDVANVIWCTGFQPDLGWLDVPGHRARRPGDRPRGGRRPSRPLLRRPAVHVLGVVGDGPRRGPRRGARREADRGVSRRGTRGCRRPRSRAGRAGTGGRPPPRRVGARRACAAPSAASWRPARSGRRRPPGSASAGEAGAARAGCSSPRRRRAGRRSRSDRADA